MSGVERYYVAYSERVRQRLLELSDVATARGDRAAFIAAVREFHRRLLVYPQFGDPLADLKHETGQLRLGIVRPLCIRYAVLEDRRIVFVTALPVLLSKSNRKD